MAGLLSKRIITYSDGSYRIETPVQWYMHKEDEAIGGDIRSCAPCPAVWVMSDDPHAKVTRQWQYYLRAINYNMTLENVYLLLDDGLAFSNGGAGYPSLSNPGDKADFFFNRNTSSTRFPNLDKVRTTSRSVLTGVVVLVGGMPHLKVKVFDSRYNPPLKPGYGYPRDISEVNPDAYRYMPETHPEMFLVANIVNRRGEVVQFPRGALYPWFEEGNTIASFVPHIANLAYGDILYPLTRLSKVPLGSPKPSPYRHDT